MSAKEPCNRPNHAPAAARQDQNQSMTSRITEEARTCRVSTNHGSENAGNGGSTSLAADSGGTSASDTRRKSTSRRAPRIVRHLLSVLEQRSTRATVGSLSPMNSCAGPKPSTVSSDSNELSRSTSAPANCLRPLACPYNGVVWTRGRSGGHTKSDMAAMHACLLLGPEACNDTLPA